MNRYLNFAPLLCLLACFYSCDDSFIGMDIQSTEITSVTNFKIRMTDAPIDYEEVNIDLQGVIIYGKTKNESDSIELGTNAGIYNLLDFQNGLDTLIASAMIEVDTVKQVKLLLGENNSVKVDGEIFPLTIPGNAKNGLRIKLCVPLVDLAEFILNIDFDAEKSVIKTGNGFKLKPVIKVLNPDVEVIEEEDEDKEEDEIELEEDDDDETDSEEEEEEDDDDDDKDDNESTLDLPTALQAYLAAEYGEYRVKSVDTVALCDETLAIQVAIQDKDDKVNLFFDQSGTFLQKTISIKKQDIPTVILDAIEEKYADFNPTNPLFKVILTDETIQYQLALRKGNEEKTILLAADGVLLCEF